MKIEVNISKSHFIILLGVVLLLGVVVFVNAVAIDKKVSHKTYQIDWEQGISSASYPASFTGKGSSVKIGDGIQEGQYGKLTIGNGPGEYGGIGLKITGVGSYLSLGTSNNYDSGITNEAMTIDPSGNVGIGITSPSAKLDVGGNIKLSGVTMAHITGSNPNCPAGGFLMRKWDAKTCDPNTNCEKKKCTTSGGWFNSQPTCNYQTRSPGFAGVCNDLTCVANQWTEAVCLGN